MKRTLLFLYIVLIVVLAVSTLVEAGRRSETVFYWVYDTLWFAVLWMVTAVMGTFYIIRCKLWRRPAVALLHLAFGIILCGAFLTWIGGTRGSVHLRKDIPENRYVESDSRRLLPLPFTLQLDSFRITNYPGTETPADYTSYLRIESRDGASLVRQVSMNRVLSYHGFRFYQSSFDPDGQGTWLRVNHDQIGRAHV